MQAKPNKPHWGNWVGAALGEAMLIWACVLITVEGLASFKLLGLGLGSAGAGVIMLAVLDPLFPLAHKTITGAMKLQMLFIAVLGGGVLAYITLGCV